MRIIVLYSIYNIVLLICHLHDSSCDSLTRGQKIFVIRHLRAWYILNKVVYTRFIHHHKHMLIGYYIIYSNLGYDIAKLQGY